MRAVLLLPLLCLPARAAEFVPVTKLDLLGGQFFYEDASTSFSGNADLTFTPAVKLDDDASLVPTIAAQYRRTREVRELVGGGFLTQESLSSLAGLRYVRKLDEAWSLKPGVAYRNELLNETEDEELGNGLFDYHKVSLTVEAERRGERWNLRPAVSAYGVRYYHYHTLSSSESDLGAEINAGDRVLDFNAYDAAFSAEHLLAEDTVLGFSALASWRPFLDQNIVQEDGTYLDSRRRDWYLLGAASAQKQLPKWGPLESAAGLTVSYAHLLSNQNSYDASRTEFIPDYYSYGEVTASPQAGLRLWEKLSATLGYEWARRRYASRLVQTEDGSYSSTGDKAWLVTHTLSAQLSYPVYKGLSLKTQASYRLSRSNVTYEGSYRYNYESAHYFTGIGLAF